MTFAARVGRLVTTAACLAAVVTVVALAAIQLSGRQLFTVVSGSMTPTFVAGDVVLVHPVEEQDLRPGQIVTFRAPGDDQHLTTHRILSLRPMEQGLFVQTKGDANEVPDPNFTYAGSVVGEVTGIIPFAGRWLMFYESTLGRLLILGTPLALLVVAQSIQTTRDIRRSRARRLEEALEAQTRAERRRTGPSAAVTLGLAVVLTVVAGAGGILLGRTTSAVYAATQSVGANTFQTGTFCTATTYRDAVLADVPAIYYRLDETTGSVAADASVNGRNGTYTGATLVGGHSPAVCGGGTAVRSTQQGRVTNPTTFGSLLGGAIRTYSIEAWVRTTTGGVIGGLTPPALAFGRYLYVGTNGLVYYTNGASTVAASTVSVADGRWHHVVLSTTGTASSLFVDGIVAGTGSGDAGLLGTSLVAGYHAPNAGAPSAPSATNGDITLDELAFYTSALSLTQVNAHRTAGGVS